MENIHVVIATFKNKISEEEIPYFRGSVIRLSENSQLFHNHLGDGYHYSYPLIQYKLIDGHAAIVGINEGGSAIKELFEDSSRYDCMLGNRRVEMELIGIRTEKFVVRCESQNHVYTLRQWLPLNRENNQAYMSSDGLVEQILMLERILLGNILSFAKGVGVFFETPVTCRILQLQNNIPYGYKNVEFKSFDVTFRTNVALPDYIGLGKSAAMNNGVLTLQK